MQHQIKMYHALTLKTVQKGEHMHETIVDKMKDTFRNEGVDTLPGQRLIAR